MENQKVTVFRQKNKVGLTVAAIVACLVLSPLLSMGFFLPQVITMVPVVLLALLAYAGPVSAAVCGGILTALSVMLFGVWGGVCALLLMVPTVIVAGVMLDLDRSFWESVAAGGVAMFASMGAVVGLLSLLAGNDIVSALTQLLEEMFSATPALGDTLLSLLMQMGVISAPEGESTIGVIGMDAQTRESLIQSLVLTMDSVLRLELPMQMATGSVTAGLLGQAALRKGMRHRGVHVDYPHLKTWRVPKGWGRILGATLALLYVLAMLVPQSMTTMFYVFNGLFNKVFALQGIAAICYLLDEHGRSRTWQGVVFIAGFFFMGDLAMIVGIFDQATDFSHRRERLGQEENPFDPRRHMDE